ncbi:SH3 domain-containing protein [Bradyrhizobium sp. Ai1a-2]|uniref:SH3 domain-containing protein n=1 Tax=Bradyrhizobium sp. Ai1a-2 TaxID=196490 RepID=UPI00048468A5|nr:SH3 domain-containing protein [Bradyrhizobium sp. Ai1a-2]
MRRSSILALGCFAAALGSILTPTFAPGTILSVAVTPAYATIDGCAVVLPTPDGFLNLREAPTANSGVVGAFRPGQRLEVDDAECETRDDLSICSAEWTRVTGIQRKDRGPPHGLQGWVASRWVRWIRCE